jgi:hypothetical protein
VGSQSRSGSCAENYMYCLPLHGIETCLLVRAAHSLVVTSTEPCRFFSVR